MIPDKKTETEEVGLEWRKEQNCEDVTNNREIKNLPHIEETGAYQSTAKKTDKRKDNNKSQHNDSIDNVSE